MNKIINRSYRVVSPLPTWETTALNHKSYTCRISGIDLTCTQKLFVYHLEFPSWWISPRSWQWVEKWTHKNIVQILITSVNLTGLENRVFADIIRLKTSRRYHARLRWGLNPMMSIRIRDRKETTQRPREEGHVKMETEIGWCITSQRMLRVANSDQKV